MTKQISLFDCLGDEYENCKSQTSTDWKWSMKDGYPTEKNGLTVFSCFACGGGVIDGLQTGRLQCFGLL